MHLSGSSYASAGILALHTCADTIMTASQASAKALCRQNLLRGLRTIR